MLRIHLGYFFNFINSLLIAGIVLSSSIIFYINIKTNAGHGNFFLRTDLYQSYLETLVLYTKLVLVMIFSFIFGSFFNKNNDAYHYLMPNYHHNKIHYFFTKMLLLIILLLVSVIIIFICFSVVGLFWSSWYDNNKGIIYLFVNLFLVLLVYGLLAVIFSILIPSIYSFFIPGFIFVLVEMLRDGNNFVHYLELILPNISLEYAHYSYYGIIHLIILVIIYLSVAGIIYYRKYNN